MNNIKVVISTGQGPLFFPVAAQYLVKVVDSLLLVSGIVVRDPNSLMMRVLGKLRGKNISAAVRKHCIADAPFTVRSCAFAQAVYQMLMICSRIIPSLGRRFERFPWIVFGWQSRKYLKGATVFHVRSGAGHGGAIKVARKYGAKILVDHSIAHPKYMEEHLRPECEKNGAVFNTGMSSPFWRMIDEDCRWADAIVVNSDFVKDTFIDAGYNPDIIKVVYLGVRDDFFGARTSRVLSSGGADKHPEDPLKLVFIGGFGFRKGGEYLLEAAKLIKQKGIPFTLDVVGDYANAQYIIDRYSDYDLPIVFHGSKPHEQLRDYLTVGDVFVFPSIAEGCAQTGMEALAAGMCVVATRQSGFPIVNGENGYIVPSKDAVAIADRIAWLNEHRGEIERTGRAAADYVRENLTWEKYASNMRAVYEDLLREGK